MDFRYNCSLFDKIVQGEWIRLENGSKKRFVFLRGDDIGFPSGFLSAKMERVLASLRVQSYNAKERIPNFMQFFGSPVKPCVWLFE